MFCTKFKQGERVFLLSVSRCGISIRQAHVRGVTRWSGGILNYDLVFGECFLFDIILEIPAEPRKNSNYGKKLLPTLRQNWTRNFCALFVKLNVDNQCMPNTSHTQAIEETLWSVCKSISPAFCSVADLVVRLWSLVWVTCGLRALWCKYQSRKADVQNARY